MSDSNQIVSMDLWHPTTLNRFVGKDKNSKSRIAQYAKWMGTTSWHQVNLELYRDYLLSRGLKSTSASAHLSTVRGAYKRMLKSVALRDQVYAATPQEAPASDRKAMVDELFGRISMAIDPINAPVEVVTKQDVADDEHIRLTKEQAQDLINAPGIDTLRGLRDTALIALMLCTGIREGEASDARIEDLRRELGGRLSFRVRDGKGHRERLVPYGRLEWVLAVVGAWTNRAGIKEGFVFRGIHKGGSRIRRNPLTERSIQRILAAYPIMVNGELTVVRPHDLRRTYARLMYEAGMDLVALSQNLGHADPRTTLIYIGVLDAEDREPPAIFRFDLSRLT